MKTKPRFRKVNPQEVQNILEDTLKKNELIYIWQISGSGVVKAEVKIKRVDVRRMEMLMEPVGNSYYYLGQMITGHGKINIHIPEKSAFFVCDYKSFKDELTLYWPEVEYCHERRKQERLEELNSSVECVFKWENKIFRKNCFDLSTMGISFIFSRQETIGIKQNNIIPDIMLKFGKETLSLSGRVTNVDLIDPVKNSKYYYPGTRVSVRFLETDHIFLQRMNKFIEKIKKYLSS